MEDDVLSTGLFKGPYGLPTGMLSSFLDAVPASVAIVDRAANLVAVNSAWRRFGEVNGSACCGDSWTGFNYLSVADSDRSDGDAAIVAGGLRAVLSGRMSHFEHDTPCHGTDEQRWFRCLIAPLTSEPEGPVTGAAVMHIDVTARKLAEDRALAASRAKSEFLASMSHELRTPLNAVIGFSEVMMLQMWGPLEDRYRDYAADIHRAGTHLLDLINDVLDLSKIEAGRYELREETVNLPALTASCVHLLQDRARAAGVAVDDRTGGAPPRLFADARLLRQIILNLLSNAIKFTPPGGRVTLDARLAEDRGVELIVTDSGIGIAPADLGRVLEPFGQVDSVQGRRYWAESTGLGLPLCKRFAELHGGRLAIASTPGLGTEVTVAFPSERVRV